MATGITEQDVWQAADALLIEGQRPTIERVRQKIGRGSPNTVQPYLDTWFKGLGARIRDPQAFSAAMAVPDPVAQAAHYLWEAAMAQARENADTALKTDRDAIEQSRLALERAQQALAQREDAMQAQVETATTALAIAHLQMEESQRREAEAHAARELAEARNEETARALDIARSHIEQVRTTSDQERREAADQAQSREQHWLAEVDRLRQELKAATRKVAEAEKLAGARIEEGQARVEQLEARLQTLTDTLLTHQQHSQQRETQHAEALKAARAELAHLSGALAEARRLRKPARSAARSPSQKLVAKVFSR